jgi:PAS domain S-box-containing protein
MRKLVSNAGWSYADKAVDIQIGQDEILRALDIINCGVVARNNAGIVLYANPRLLEWLRYERSEVEGRPIDQLVPADLVDAMAEEIQAIGAGDLRARLCALRRKDGTAFPVLIIPQRLTDEEGKLVGGVGVVVDLGAVQTAKSMPRGGGGELRGALDKIALELQSLGLAADIAPSSAVALEHVELADLSVREREVVALLMAGERVPAIAKQLHISPHTVRNHLKSVFRKLDVGSQSELIQRVRALES